MKIVVLDVNMLSLSVIDGVVDKNNIFLIVTFKKNKKIYLSKK